MKLLKRIGYYLIGVSLGSIVVLFIWKGKDVSFDYGMDARTLSSIRKKQLVFTADAQRSMRQFDLDSLSIQKMLNNGADVNFGKSKAQQKPCAGYYIEGKDPFKGIHFFVERCDSIATVTAVWKKQ